MKVNELRKYIGRCIAEEVSYRDISFVSMSYRGCDLYRKFIRLVNSGVDESKAFVLVFYSSRVNYRCTEVTHKGVTYESITCAIRELGYNYNTVWNYLRKGYSFSDAIDILDRIRRRKSRLVYRGVQYDSIKKACRDLGVPYNKVYYFTRKGYSLERAVDTVLGKKRF